MTKFNLLRVSLILGLVALMLAVNSLNAQAYPTSDGQLDSSFGTAGIVQTPVYVPAEGVAQAVVVQPDGKIVTGGSGGEGPFGYRWLLSRFNSDGSLDTLFGQRGHVTIEFPNFKNTINSLAIEADGKILAAGTSGVPNGGGETRATLIRFNSDGNIDNSFGILGVVYEPALIDFTAVVLQSDNQIVVGGTRSHEDGSSDFAVLRLNPNGNRDSSFGIEGEADTSFERPHSRLNALTLLPNGSIWAVGETSTEYFGSDILAVAAYTPAGAPDGGVSDDGKFTIDLSSANEYATTALVAPSGDIVLGGVADGDFLLVRLKQTGQADPDFGQNGVVRTSFDSMTGLLKGLTLQNGKLLAAGSAQEVNSGGGILDSKFALVRYNSNGTIDTSFGGGKVTLYIINGQNAIGNAVTTTASGDVVVAGTSTISCNNGDSRCKYSGVALAQFTPTGTLTTGFGTPPVAPGKALASPEFSWDKVVGMVAQPDGKSVVVGNTQVSITTYFPFALRYNTDGSLDTSFGDSSHLIKTPLQTAAAVAVQSDGKLVIVGTNSNAAFGLIRLLADGNLDTSFGTQGYVETDFGVDLSSATAVAVQPDGKIVVAGHIAGISFVVVRYNPNGALDTTFGTGGKVVTDLAPSESIPNDLIVAADGKLIVAGSYVEDYEMQNTLMMRYNPNGSIDTSFGDNGKVFAILGDGWNVVNKLALQSDGKIVAAGTHSYDCDSYDCRSGEYAVARYNVDGSRDISFGDNGHVWLGLAGPYSSAQFISVAADGSIVTAGARGDSFLYFVDSLLVVRLHADGSLDGAFANGGVLQVNLSGGVKSQLIQPDGKILVAGQTAASDGTVVTLLRVQNTVGANTPTVTPTLAATRTPTATRTGTSTSTPISTPVAFSDVHPDDYFYAPVQYLMQHGVISGYADNTFRPYNNTTRGQLTKIVVLGNGWTLDSPATATFSDVPVGSAFFTFVETALQHSIISGYADNTYRPNNNVTRAQLSKVIVLARGWTLANPSQPTFVDVARGDASFHVVETAVQHGIISGYDLANGTREFRPSADATRAQIAKIVYLSITQ